MDRRTFWLLMLVLCLCATVTMSGCTRDKPMPTPTATTVPAETMPESSPTVLPSSTPVEPTPTRYTVRAGDTLWAIADRFEVSVEALLEANELPEPDRLQPGQELVIPANGGTPSSGSGGEESALEENGDVESETVHTVVAGDNLWNIAMRYGTTVEDIAQLNDLDPEALLSIGQRLRIP